MILIYCTSLGKRHPTNMILLTIFTLCESYSLAYLGTKRAEVVIAAGLITAAVTVALFIYALSSKSDFTYMGGFLFICASALLAAVIINFFVESSPFGVIISCIGAVIFGMYIIYDVQIMTGKKAYSLSIDDYVVGAINLYVDILGLFLDLVNIIDYFNR